MSGAVLFCRACGGLTITGAHVCPPAWVVDAGDFGTNVVHALSARAAAELWAEEFDARGDYTVISGSPVDVAVVRRDGSGGPERFRVKGESVPTYTAKRLEKGE